MNLTPQDFDEYQRKNVLKELEQNPKGCVVGCLYDLYFPDNKLTECSRCGIPLFVRPWLFKAAQEHNLRIVCQLCVDPKELKGKIIQDIAKIEQEKLGINSSVIIPKRLLVERREMPKKIRDRVLDLLASSQKPLNALEIAKALGVKPQYLHLKEMEDEGLIVIKNEGWVLKCLN
jgi:hypothetical protein